MKKKIQALCASLFMGILLFMAGVQTFAEPSYTSKFSDWGNLLKQYANDENGNETIRMGSHYMRSLINGKFNELMLR